MLMSPEELTNRVELHGKWLVGDPDGVRMELPGEDLSEANLSNTNLTKADLTKANLKAANLRQADLTGANLRAAILAYADLSGATMTETILEGADLTGAILDTLEDTAARDDLFTLLNAAPSEVGPLRDMIREGRTPADPLAYLRALDPPADRWFKQLRHGTPADHPAAQLILRWLDEWEAL